MKAKLLRSHLIIESPSMGLIMRYIFTKDFKTEIAFCSDLTLSVNDKESEFFFEDIKNWKMADRDAISSGHIRSTMYQIVFELEENTFTADEWHKRYLAVANIGLFMFQ
jgi:hypothetical protein